MAVLHLFDMAKVALTEFARVYAQACIEFDFSHIVIDVAPAPHRTRALPAGKMAVYCFFLNGKALKIGIAGPKSNARFCSQHYGVYRARSTLAKSIFERPDMIGIETLPADSVGDWIRDSTDRVDLLLPSSLGRPVLHQLEFFLHARWRPIYEGVMVAVVSDEVKPVTPHFTHPSSLIVSSLDLSRG